MADDIGSLVVKVGMDSKLFQEGVTTLNKKMGLLRSEFQATASNVKVFGNSTEQMKTKVEYLSKTVDLQKSKVQQLAQAYEKTKAETGEYSDQTVKAGTSLNKAISYFNKLEQELKGTSTELATQTSKWNQLAIGMENASGKMKSVGQTLSSVGRGLTTSLTLPILGIGVATTKMAMDAIESENLFEVSFGNMAESARKWSEETSKALGLNAYDVRKNSATYYTMLTSMGLTEKEAYKMSTSFTQLSYDMASFYNLKPEEAFNKLKAGITGEAEPLKALGVLINETTTEAYAMEHGIGTLTKTKKGFKLELSETDKVMARYGLIMQSTSKAQGDLGRTMDSPTNKLRIQTEQLKQQGIELGTKLIPLMSKGLDVVKDVVDWLGGLNDEQRDMIIKFGLAAAAAGPLISTLGSLTSISGGVVGAVGKISKAFGTAKIATAGIGTAAEVATGVAGAGGIAGLSTSLAGLALAAAPWIAAGAVVAGTGYLIYKGLSTETIPAIDLFADKVETTSTSVTGNYKDMATKIDTNVVKINESTKKAVGAYIKMDDDVTKAMLNLQVNSEKITTDTSNSLVAKYNEMGTQIKTGLDKRYNETFNIMQAFFKNSAALSDKEEAEALKKLQQNNESEKKTIQDGVSAIKLILEKASKEKRELTSTEQQAIAIIQDNMKQDAIKALSETEIESKVILERLKGYSERITAEQSAEVVKNANNTRDKAIKAANEQYDKTVASIIKMRDESHSITADQANKLIENATKQKNDTITKAQEMREGVVSKLKQMNPDVEREVNLQTGTIMKAWDKVKTWWDNLKFKEKTLSVNTPESITGRFNVATNFAGTNSFQGGLTTLHEKGYEVYDLPRGTRIYNHQASEDLALKTATQVAKSVLGNANIQSSGVSTIVVPVTIDGREIARATASYTNYELGRLNKQNNLAYGGV